MVVDRATEHEEAMPASTSVSVTGHGPLSFTDSQGGQQILPLAAVVLQGSTLALAGGWADKFAAPGPFTPDDAATLLAVANAHLAAGELLPPPISPPTPAIVFKAATPGVAGNSVSIAIVVPAADVFTAEIGLTASEIDFYGGLADGVAAAAAIGLDTPGVAAGSGLVSVKAAGTIAAGKLPKKQSMTVTAPTDAVADDGSTVFTLVPRAGVPAGGVGVKIDVDAATNTFSLTASFEAKATTKMLPPPLALTTEFLWLVTATSPAAALPAAGSVVLSGGGPGVTATGIAYTS